MRSSTRPEQRGDRAGREGTPVPRDRHDRAAHEGAESLRRVEERRERTHDRRPIGVADPFEREQEERGVHQRHARREHDGADHEPCERRPNGDDPDPDRGEGERDAACVAAPQPVGHPRAEDAHDEDQHAVEQEDRARVDVQVMGRIQRHERAEPGQRDQAEEQHGAGPDRGPVHEVSRLGFGSLPFDLDGEHPDERGGERERGGDDERQRVARRPPQVLTERGTERQPAVHRDRPVRHGLAAAFHR